MGVLWKLLLLLCLAAAAQGQVPDRIEAAHDPASIVLSPGDVVRLDIWREPDLSGEFPVDETGVVVFPKLGPMQVLDETAESLREKLVSAYQRYLRNPSIKVTLLRRVRVLGEVRNPGLYAVDPTVNVGDVLALAGGVTPEGDPRRVELVRAGERLTTTLSPNATLAQSQVRTGDQISVRQRGWFARNPHVVTAALTGLVSVLVLLVTR